MRYVVPEQYCRKRLGIERFPEWKTAVICFRGIGGSTGLVNLLEGKPISAKAFWGMGEAYGVAQPYEAMVNGQPVVILPQCIWGGVQAAILTEELACYGCKTVIGYGCAGSIVPSVELLQQVVVKDAIPTDGTSRAYGESESAADPRLIRLAQDAANQLGIDLVQVRAATVDAVYRETPELVEAWRSMGAEAINMESSALYASARACDVKSVWIGFVSDRLGATREHPAGGRTGASSVSAHLCRKLLELVVG